MFAARPDCRVSVCGLLQPREGSYIWKMHLVKGQEGLGIQITGGRGSKRSPHGINIANIEDGGTIHRWAESGGGSYSSISPEATNESHQRLLDLSSH